MLAAILICEVVSWLVSYKMPLSELSQKPFKTVLQKKVDFWNIINRLRNPLQVYVLQLHQILVFIEAVFLLTDFPKVGVLFVQISSPHTPFKRDRVLLLLS